MTTLAALATGDAPVPPGHATIAGTLRVESEQLQDWAHAAQDRGDPAAQQYAMLARWQAQHALDLTAASVAAAVAVLDERLTRERLAAGGEDLSAYPGARA